MSAQPPALENTLRWLVVLTSWRLALPCRQVDGRTVSINHGGEGSNQPQDTSDTRPEVEEQVKQVPRKLLLETTDPPLHTAVDMVDTTSSRIVRLFGQDGVTLDLKTEHHEWRKRVSELQDTSSADKHDPRVNLRNGLRDNPSNYPVEWNKEDEDPFTALAFEEWELEEVSSHVVVENFDADIAVQNSGDQTSNETDDVASSLPAIRRHALVRNVVRILSLHAVSVQAVNHVAEVDEDVGSKKSLPEVHWAAHFRHELDEKRGATEREDSVHESVDVVNQTKTRRRTSGDLDRVGVVNVEIRV